MNYHFTIGEVSKILNISKDTLRYYDKIRLLSSDNHGENSYRYYGIEQLDTLITIKMLRKMGISIEDIKFILSDDSLKSIESLLTEKDKELKQQIQYINALQTKLCFLGQELSGFDDNSEVAAVMRPRFWALLTESIIESQDKTLDRKINDLLQSVNSELISLGHTVSIVSKENILSSNYHTYLHNGIISPQEIPGEVFEETFCMRKYVVINKNKYGDLDLHYEAMKAFAAKNNYGVIGNSMEVNIYNQYSKHYIAIYIPISKADGSVKGI